jgi:hypothetical protein
MTRADWNVSLYAGAAWGGFFWLVLSLCTKLIGPHPLASSTILWTVGVSLAVGAVGLLLFRVSAGSTGRRVGAALGIGALIGLPVLGWVALW